MGVKTLPGLQILFLDTPGLHHPRDLMNRRMVERARLALEEADLALWLLDSRFRLGPADREIAELLRPRARSTIVALNKIDCVPKSDLLPRVEEVACVLAESTIVPVSALSGENLEELLRVLAAALPEGPRYYPEGEITDETERELAAEIVREKVMMETRDEVPYNVAVTVDSFKDVSAKDLAVIHATIHVNRASQKPIVLGRGGSRLKTIGKLARVEIEAMLGRRVFLELFVRVEPGWTRETRRLKEFGL